jgi:hypothetical protein
MLRSEQRWPEPYHECHGRDSDFTLTLGTPTFKEQLEKLLALSG